MELFPSISQHFIGKFVDEVEFKVNLIISIFAFYTYTLMKSVMIMSHMCICVYICICLFVYPITGTYKSLTLNLENYQLHYTIITFCIIYFSTSKQFQILAIIKNFQDFISTPWQQNKSFAKEFYERQYYYRYHYVKFYYLLTVYISDRFEEH